MTQIDVKGLLYQEFIDNKFESLLKQKMNMKLYYSS